MLRSEQNPSLRLIGKQSSGTENNTPFLVEMFGRFSEVKHTGGLTRQIQYASGDGEDKIHFMGFEVERIEDIPEGMIAWYLDSDSLSVFQTRNGKTEIVRRESISWNWLDMSVPQRPCGEFTRLCTENGGNPVQRDFRIVSHSYLGAPGSDDIYLVEYDPSWPAKYELIKRELLGLIGPETALRIEHYGSTSIPGMPAKPIIDILVEIPSWEECRKRAISAFNVPNVEYWFYNDHMVFIVRDKVTGIRTEHIHMALGGHRIWEGLAFRDYLKTHPTDANRYLALKRDLAERHQEDREAYTDAKGAFVREITDKALHSNSH